MSSPAKRLKENFNNLISTLIFFPVVLLLAKRTKFPKQRADKDCIVIGNGPSLTRDIEKINFYSDDFDKICVNFFGDSDLYGTVKPSVYVLYDPIFWMDGSGDVYARRDRLFKKIQEETTWEMTFYAPFDFRKSDFYLHSVNQHIKFIFFNAISVDGFPGFIRYCLSHRLGMPRASNVIIPSLVYAISRGYQKIYLTGADHSWHQDIAVKSDSRVYVVHKHFSDTSEPKPIYLMPGDQQPATMHQLFLTWANLFRGYELINDYAIRNHSEILNLTEDSFIDAFKKI